MTPSAFKAGGPRERIRFALGECSLGSILVAATERGICAISLGKEPEGLLQELQRQFPRAKLVGADAQFEAWVAQVVALVEEPAKRHHLPLDIRGTAFQERVWQALRRVPAGKQLSYRELAERIGSPNAVRAVANACGQNRVAVAIPCHRVVRTDGSLSGYRWGVERKRTLLEREAKR
jgi:AraC family transcriptional regulator of adaptative response/methylated-DNA-[protein]-cysteine methyltransferase